MTKEERRVLKRDGMIRARIIDYKFHGDGARMVIRAYSQSTGETLEAIYDTADRSPKELDRLEWKEKSKEE